MTTEQFLEAEMLNEKILARKARVTKVKKAISDLKESITERGSIEFPFQCPLNGSKFLVTSLDLQALYDSVLTRESEAIADLEFKFKEL